MVKVTGLKKYFNARRTGLLDKPAPVRALDDISFSIGAGSTLGMVGESGQRQNHRGALHSPAHRTR